MDGKKTYTYIICARGVREKGDDVGQTQIRMLQISLQKHTWSFCNINVGYDINKYDKGFYFKDESCISHDRRLESLGLVTKEQNTRKTKLQ